MKEPKSQLGITFANDSVFTFGGYHNRVLADCEMFNGFEWSKIGEMNKARTSAGVCKLGDYVYIVAGTGECNIERFSPVTYEFNFLLFRLPTEGSCVALT